MVVDPQRTEIPSGGEPASSGSFESQLDAQLAQWAEQAQSEATDEGDGVLSPPNDSPPAASGEPASAEQGADVPSPDAEADPAIVALERREGESRAAWVARVQAYGEERATAARDAEQRAREAEQKLAATTTATQQRYEQLQKWLGPSRDSQEWRDLERQARDGDWEARQQIEAYEDRQQYQDVLRLASFAEMADALEGVAEMEGLSREQFRAAHGNKLPNAIGLIAQAAVSKATAPLEAQIAKLKDDLKNEQTAHQSTKDKALAGGLQPVSGGRPGGGGPLGQYTDSRGIPADDAIEAALEGKLAGLDLTTAG